MLKSRGCHVSAADGFDLFHAGKTLSCSSSVSNSDMMMFRSLSESSPLFSSLWNRNCWKFTMDANMTPNALVVL